MIYLRYWGSHFKTSRHVAAVTGAFRPMLERGWECHLVLEREPEDPCWMKSLKALGVVTHCEPRPKRKIDRKCISRVVKLCRNLRPDVFVCENIHDSPLIGAAIARVPVRVWIKHAMNSDFDLDNWRSLKNRITLTTRLSCALATKVIAVSGAVRNELTGLGIRAGKVLVRPNPRGVGPPPTLHCRTAERTRLGLDPADVVWISVGHAVPVKGWDMLIRAFRRVVDSDPRAKLLLVGGVERPEEIPTAMRLHAEIERLDLRGMIRLTGQVEDVNSLLRASDAFVLCSRSEGFSIALIEALEAGLPCVATQVGIAGEVIRQGFNGMLIEKSNEERLAEALIGMTCDDALRARLAANAGVPEAIPTLEEYAQRMADDFSAWIDGRSH